MTKEQFLEKWGWQAPPENITADLDAVIANEIAKAMINSLPDKVDEQPAPFDKDRFEAMFRAVVASGRNERWEQDFKSTEEALAKLDAYYASKEEGGNNG